MPLQPRSSPPEDIRRAGAAARVRTGKRRPSLGLAIDVTEEGYALGPPHDDQDGWEAMLCDLFGTGSVVTATYHLGQLAQMCRTELHEQTGQNVPSHAELLAALNMVAGFRPRNEAQCAVAVGAVAMHLMMMRLATDTLSTMQIRHPDAALSAKLGRTVAMQVQTLSGLQGKTSQQRIIVKQERHDHRHQHIHIEGGSAKINDQPHGPSSLPIDTANGTRCDAVGQPSGCAALSGKGSKRKAVSVTGDKG
ncbi:hypothetical protein [Sphingomonas sp.]|uniref:hypothetical protein n=1 Tax=Sphingomonas sp. TaxID=28214 RepID=UPI0025F54D54|nr:hypothetical protein [Sphingomonas sp.]